MCGKFQTTCEWCESRKFFDKKIDFSLYYLLYLNRVWSKKNQKRQNWGTPFREIFVLIYQLYGQKFAEKGKSIKKVESGQKAFQPAPKSWSKYTTWTSPILKDRNGFLRCLNTSLSGILKSD